MFMCMERLHKDTDVEIFRGVIDGKTYRQSAVDATGNADLSRASNAASKVRQKISHYMDTADLRVDHLIEIYLKPALSASETKHSQYRGQFTDEREVIAWDTRLRALDIAFRLHGGYKQAQDEDKDSGDIVVQIVNIGGNVQVNND